MRSYVDTVMSDYQNISYVDRRASLYMKRTQMNQVEKQCVLYILIKLIYFSLFLSQINQLKDSVLKSNKETVKPKDLTFASSIVTKYFE